MTPVACGRGLRGWGGRMRPDARPLWRRTHHLLSALGWRRLPTGWGAPFHSEMFSGVLNTPAPDAFMPVFVAALFARDPAWGCAATDKRHAFALKRAHALLRLAGREKARQGKFKAWRMGGAGQASHAGDPSWGHMPVRRFCQRAGHAMALHARWPCRHPHICMLHALRSGQGLRKRRQMRLLATCRRSWGRPRLPGQSR